MSKILVDRGEKLALKEEFHTSWPTVRDALSGRFVIGMSADIRKRAIERGGVEVDDEADSRTRIAECLKTLKPGEYRLEPYSRPHLEPIRRMVAEAAGEISDRRFSVSKTINGYRIDCHAL